MPDGTVETACQHVLPGQLRSSGGFALGEPLGLALGPPGLGELPDLLDLVDHLLSFLEGKSPFGAFDMAGNVWEWTADWYGEYTKAAATNPHGAETGTTRVDRGGGWISFGAGIVRAAFRSWDGASLRHIDVGFRCARGD